MEVKVRLAVLTVEELNALAEEIPIARKAALCVVNFILTCLACVLRCDKIKDEMVIIVFNFDSNAGDQTELLSRAIVAGGNDMSIFKIVELAQHTRTRTRTRQKGKDILQIDDILHLLR